MRHIRVVALALAAATTVAVATGCGSGAPDEVTTALAPDGAALAALGYDPYDLAVADPLAVSEDYDHGRRWGWHRRGPGPGHGHGHRHGAILREDMLHGEMVVDTGDGAVTMLVQRGEVTEVTDTGVAVTSTDGFAQTWTFADDLRVVESRTEVDRSELSTGTEIGLAGRLADGSPEASLIVITGA